MQLSEPKSAIILQIYCFPITYSAAVWLVFICDVPLFVCLSTSACNID